MNGAHECKQKFGDSAQWQNANEKRDRARGRAGEWVGGGGSVEMETRSDRLLSNRKRQRKSVHRMPVILMSQKKNRVDWYILNLIKVGS